MTVLVVLCVAVLFFVCMVFHLTRFASYHHIKAGFPILTGVAILAVFQVIFLLFTITTLGEIIFGVVGELWAGFLGIAVARLIIASKAKIKGGDSLLTHVALVTIIAVTIFPVLWVIKMAFTDQQGFTLSINPFPEDPTIVNFKNVLMTKGDHGEWLFGQQLLNSVIVSAATTIMGIFMACTAGYAFSRFKFPGRRMGLLSFLVSQMFPGTLMMVSLYIILDKLNLLDNLLGLVLVYSTIAIPFCVWMLKGYFDTIPKELEESALIDGASQFTIFWRIILPLAKPAVAVTALFSFMTAWNEFILAATFMESPGTKTLPVVLQNYVGQYDTKWGLFAAGAVVVSIPVIALFFALQKYLVGGLTAGSVKG